jgi:hypothetical protein
LPDRASSRTSNRPSKIPRLPRQHRRRTLPRPPRLHQRTPGDGWPNHHGGYVVWIGKPQEGRSSTQEDLLQAGTVLYARTTQPQAIMHLETSTNICGITTSPWNTDLTPGGRSGGDSALIACRGSILVSSVGSEWVGGWRLIVDRVWVVISEARFVVLLPIREPMGSSQPLGESQGWVL